MTALSTTSGLTRGLLLLDSAIQRPVRLSARRPAVGTAAPARALPPPLSSRSAPDPTGVLTCARTIESARRGDRAALAALLRALQDPWYRLSLGLLRDADLAAEAVQETGLRFLRQVAGFRGDSQIRTWSLGIAINVARELKRRRGRFVTGTVDEDGRVTEAPGGDRLADPGRGAPDGAVLAEQRAALRAVLTDLPDRQREAIVLRFFEDLSVEETARAMGCAAGTVKATVHQALRSLKKRMERWV
ncbi:MAG TPA: RNA polymerase sigma factor [Humisphaera sp.]